MRYMMKQKMFSFGDDFKIQDEQGREVYFVDGKALSIGSKLAFKDMQGNELAFIKQKVMSFKPTFEIYKQGNLHATVKKEFTFFKKKFTIAIPGQQDMEAKGNFIDYEYEINKGGKWAGKISRRALTLTDTYAVDIADDEDQITVLATTVAIDMINAQDKKK